MSEVVLVHMIKYSTKLVHSHIYLNIHSKLPSPNPPNILLPPINLPLNQLIPNIFLFNFIPILFQQLNYDPLSILHDSPCAPRFVSAAAAPSSSSAPPASGQYSIASNAVAC